MATSTTLDPDAAAYAWVDHGLVLRSTPLSGGDILCGVDDTLFNAIDPHLFVDLDDKPWLVFGSTLEGLMLVDIDPETFAPTQHPRDFVQLAARDLLQDDPIIGDCRHREGGITSSSPRPLLPRVATTYKILVGRSMRSPAPMWTERAPRCSKEVARCSSSERVT